MSDLLALQQAAGAAAENGFISGSMQAGITNLIIAMTSLITAIGVVLVNVIVARAKTRLDAAAQLVTKKADEINETTKVTLGHVNSAATEMRAVINALRDENIQLRTTVRDNQQIAAVLAATHAAAPPIVTPAPLPPSAAVTSSVDPIAPTLAAIEKNTAETAEHTAPLVPLVQTLKPPKKPKP